MVVESKRLLSACYSVLHLDFNRNVNAIIKGKVSPAFLYMAERRRNESVCCLYRGLKEQCNGCDPFTQPGHDTS